MLLLPARRGASSGAGAPPYVRHRPERTLLYQVVAEHYPALKAHLAAQGNALPGYVEQGFEDDLKCGRLEHGFLCARCESCHAEHLLASSCKKRGFCPSCGGRCGRRDTTQRRLGASEQTLNAAVGISEERPPTIEKVLCTSNSHASYRCTPVRISAQP